jgi:DNA-binding LacI/PurR family transcriptional regulator
MMSATERNSYQRIAAALKGRISSGALVSGSFLPTERELQIQFAASRSTVRRALACLVEEGFAQSIPNRGVIAAKGPGKKKATGNVALIEYGSYVLRLMGARLASRVRQEGMYLVNLGGSVDYPPNYALQTALDNDFAGVIIWPYRSFIDNEFVRTASRQLPVVALDHRIEGVNTDLVTVDHESAAALATEQLIRNGCRNIAITGELDGLEITHQRFRGYMRAMFAHSLQPEPKNFVFMMTSGCSAPDPSLLHHRLNESDRPDGLLVLQDIYVPVAVETMHRSDLSIPKDIKVATIGDDIELTVDNVGLTAVAFDWDAMAEQALQLLLDRIADPTQPTRVRLVPHHLIVRGLCGAPKEDWTDPLRDGPWSSERVLPRSRYQYSSPRIVLDDSAQFSQKRSIQK